MSGGFLHRLPDPAPLFTPIDAAKRAFWRARSLLLKAGIPWEDVRGLEAREAAWMVKYVEREPPVVKAPEVAG